jgi:hypothetical protein
MSATLDKIVEEFRNLEPEEQGQLLEILEREKRSSERAALARSVRGKYAHVRTSSEDFIAQKREETRREDSRLEGGR